MRRTLAQTVFCFAVIYASLSLSVCAPAATLEMALPEACAANFSRGAYYILGDFGDGGWALLRKETGLKTVENGVLRAEYDEKLMYLVGENSERPYDMTAMMNVRPAGDWFVYEIPCITECAAYRRGVYFCDVDNVVAQIKCPKTGGRAESVSLRASADDDTLFEFPYQDKRFVQFTSLYAKPSYDAHDAITPFDEWTDAELIVTEYIPVDEVNLAYLDMRLSEYDLYYQMVAVDANETRYASQITPLCAAGEGFDAYPVKPVPTKEICVNPGDMPMKLLDENGIRLSLRSIRMDCDGNLRFNIELDNQTKDEAKLSITELKIDGQHFNANVPYCALGYEAAYTAIIINRYRKETLSTSIGTVEFSLEAFETDRHKTLAGPVIMRLIVNAEADRFAY